MKKIISVSLAFLMLFALFACNGTKDADSAGSPSTQTSQAPASSSPSQAAAPDSAEPETVPTMEDVTAGENSVGFFSSGVDPQSRDTYHIVFAYTMSMLLYEQLYQAMADLSDKLNIEVTKTTGELDADKYITNIETLASQGIDGFIAEIDQAVSDRINEVYQELGIPYITMISAVYQDGKPLAPCVLLDGYDSGATTVQWLYDNYKNYWGDIDTSKIALLDYTFSVLPDLQVRADGAIDKFKELFPNNTQFFTADAAVTSKVDPETAYNETAPIFSAHPEVEYWWVACSIETFAQGTARAVESLEMEDHVLIVDVGSDVLCSEWDTGYDGCWVSCLAISNYLYVTPTLCALVAMLDGTATWDTLWTGKRAPGSDYTLYYVGNEMVTKDTYKQYFQDISDALGLG
jgi:ABC-type sugar transport system substrate-binding protein